MARKFIKRKSAVKPITGSIVDTKNIIDKTTNTYSAGVIDDKISKAGGVEVGTIVNIDKNATTPEGWQDVTDEDEITLVEPSELFTISEGFTLLFDSNIYKHRNRYFGDITIQKDEGNFDEWGNTVATFKKTMIGMCNTGCFLCAGQWNTNVVGHCFIGATEISVANKTGVNNYNVAKIKFDVVSNETNATKPIEKKSVTPIEPKTGHIYDTTNIDNKAENTYSAEIIDKFNTYSTEEQVVGKWIDGRPIYRKVFIFTNHEVAGQQVITLIDMGNIIQIVDFRGNVTFMGNTYLLGDWTKADMLGCAWNSDHGRFLIYNPYTEQRTFADIKVIIEYTKTTDKADVMINFTVNCSNTNIGNKTYQAEYGMTWREWINSEYNVDGYYLDEDAYVRLNATYYIAYPNTSTDVIQSGMSYETVKGK